MLSAGEAGAAVSGKRITLHRTGLPAILSMSLPVLLVIDGEREINGEKGVCWKCNDYASWIFCLVGGQVCTKKV